MPSVVTRNDQPNPFGALMKPWSQFFVPPKNNRPRERTTGWWLVGATAGMLGLLLPGPATARQIPALPELSPTLVAAYPDLARERQALVAERDVLRESTKQHNKRCEHVEEGSAAEANCDISYAQLAAKVERHIDASEKFIDTFTIRTIHALAGRQKWSTEELDRLARALKALTADGDPNATDVMIRQSWRDILARAEDKKFAQAASTGDGPGLPGAGTQTRFEDCAIFALANAAHLPYGVVAARATEVIREGEWRPAAERANPQKVIEQRGLMGGEVVLLAEAFGQVEVVASTDFAKTLKQGRPVMVNVVPASGDMSAGHQVVLTKTFRHGNETWYEMMDSNQGPIRRLYLSHKELNTILQENGVAFRPEPRTVPQLLR